MAFVFNSGGNSSGNPCGLICSRFDLKSWNEQASAEIRRAKDLGINMTDLEAVRLVPYWTPLIVADIRAAIDTSSQLAQVAYDRFTRKVMAMRPGVARPGVTRPDAPNKTEWKLPSLPGLPGLPSWPGFPDLSKYLWWFLVAAGFLILWKLSD